MSASSSREQQRGPFGSSSSMQSMQLPLHSQSRQPLQPSVHRCSEPSGRPWEAGKATRQLSGLVK
eukprot:1143903-Pelagomonas_calceolata.AAC.4